MKKRNLLKGMMVAMLATSLLVGCGSQNSKNESMKKVAIIQLAEHTSLNTIKDAFDKQMEALGYKDGENVEYVFKNAQGDNNTAASIIQDFQGKNPDVVMAIATPVAQAAAKMSKQTPVVFAAVSDPIGAKLTSSLEKPDKNITGTSDEIQVELILEKALQVNPNLKKLGVLYNKGEANSVTNINKAKAFAKEKGIEIVEATVTGVNEVQSAIDVLTSKCDAVFAPNDNTVASAMNVVSKACVKAKVPFYVGADSMVQDGGFLSVGINYEELGKETANMVDQVLKGKDIKDIPVKVFKENLNIYVNENVYQQLGIQLPESIKNDKSLSMMK
ncbi:MAG: ABC transporter substrate-binding protein [Longibaculum sp.]